MWRIHVCLIAQQMLFLVQKKLCANALTYIEYSNVIGHLMIKQNEVQRPTPPAPAHQRMEKWEQPLDGTVNPFNDSLWGWFVSLSDKTQMATITGGGKI